MQPLPPPPRGAPLQPFNISHSFSFPTHSFAPPTLVLSLSPPRETKLTGARYCERAGAGPWREAIKEEQCDKGFMMLFLHWICETYLAKRRKRAKRKSVNQYWRDFKMLYRRVNRKQTNKQTTFALLYCMYNLASSSSTS